MKKIHAVIGRFNPSHKGHLSLFRAAMEDCDKLIIILGSAERPVDIRNPFTDHDRAAMISAMLESDLEIKKMISGSHNTPRCATYFVGVHDYFYGDKDVRWTSEVVDKVNQVIGDDECEVTLFGHHRDGSSYYLDIFPDWKYQEVEEDENGLNATMIRESMFNHGKVPEHALSPSVEQFVNHWMTTKQYENLRGDWLMVQKRNRQASSYPYKLTFNTADAVVFHKAKVLMVVRGVHPGKGLLALPGGYLHVDADHATIDTAIRELYEETGLVVTEETCKSHPNFPGVFGHKDRSVRGRIITHAYKWILDNDHDIPVIGSDDAVKALWVPLNEIPRKYHMIFEDHAEIIEIMANS